MSLDTRDNDPNWASAFQVSPEQARQQRQSWLEAGRRAWDAATRAGKDVQARTESDLVALGKRALDSAGHTAQAVLGTDADPSPLRVVGEWATGQGPENRDLPAGSRFSNEFVQAGNVQGHLRRATDAWKARPGGMDAQNGTYTQYKATMGLPEYLGAGANLAAREVGSSRFDGQRAGDRLDWTANNKMGLNSLFYRRYLAGLKSKGVPDVDRPAPGGSTYQAIHFRTDLEGRPLR